jgi:hypothetical protein
MSTSDISLRSFGYKMSHNSGARRSSLLHAIEYYGIDRVLERMEDLEHIHRGGKYSDTTSEDMCFLYEVDASIGWWKQVQDDTDDEDYVPSEDESDSDSDVVYECDSRTTIDTRSENSVISSYSLTYMI